MTRSITEPCDLDATAARRLIGRKALSPVELTESCIKRLYGNVRQQNHFRHIPHR